MDATNKSGTPYVLPPVPEGTDFVIRSRCVEDDQVELKRVDFSASGTYSPFTPLQDFSAFSASGEHLGSWSPGYPSLGWQRFVNGWSPGTATHTLLTLRELAGWHARWRLEWDRLREGKTVFTFARSN